MRKTLHSDAVRDGFAVWRWVVLCSAQTVSWPVFWRRGLSGPSSLLSRLSLAPVALVSRGAFGMWSDWPCVDCPALWPFLHTHCVGSGFSVPALSHCLGCCRESRYLFGPSCGRAYNFRQWMYPLGRILHVFSTSYIREVITSPRDATSSHRHIGKYKTLACRTGFRMIRFRVPVVQWLLQF